MSGSNCIFCKIIAKTIPATIIAQTDDLLVIQDIAPKAPIHWLIIPKKHITGISDLAADDSSIAANILFMAQTLSKTLPAPQAFRLLFNNGIEAGQTVFHLHAHVLSGTTMHE